MVGVGGGMKIMKNRLSLVFPSVSLGFLSFNQTKERVAIETHFHLNTHTHTHTKPHIFLIFISRKYIYCV